MHGRLQDVREGMKVYDRTDSEIGTVEMVKLSDEDPETPAAEVVDVNPVEEPGRNSWLDDLAEVFRPDELPEALRARLLREGFIRIDAAGLFAADRYVLPEQIASVSGDRLTLSVTKDELAKRH